MQRQVAVDLCGSDEAATNCGIFVAKMQRQVAVDLSGSNETETNCGISVDEMQRQVAVDLSGSDEAATNCGIFVAKMQRQVAVDLSGSDEVATNCGIPVTKMQRQVAVDLSAPDEAATDPAASVAIDVGKQCAVTERECLEPYIATNMGKPIVFDHTSSERGYGVGAGIMLFLISFTMRGFMESFVVLQDALTVQSPNGSEWMMNGDVLKTLFFLIPPVAAALCASLGSQTLVSTGSAICAFGIGLSGFAASPSFLMSSPVVWVGFGVSYIDSCVCVPWKRKFGILIVSYIGGCIGAVIMPVIVSGVADALGVAVTVFTMTGMFLVLCFVGSLYLEGCAILSGPMTTLEEIDASLRRRSMLNRALLDHLGLRFVGRPLFVLMACSVFGCALAMPHVWHQIRNHAEAMSMKTDELAWLELLPNLGQVLAVLTYALFISQSSRAWNFPAVIAVSGMCALSSVLCTRFWQFAAVTLTGAFAGGAAEMCIPLVLSRNHGPRNTCVILGWIRFCQGLANILYRRLASEVTADESFPDLLIFSGVILLFSAILAAVMLLLPSDTSSVRTALEWLEQPNAHTRQAEYVKGQNCFRPNILCGESAP